MNKGQAARKKTLRNKVVEHHIIYNFNHLAHKQKEIVVPVKYMEHWILTQLQRRGNTISRGFVNSLKYLIWMWETTGIINDNIKVETMVEE